MPNGSTLSWIIVTASTPWSSRAPSKAAMCSAYFPNRCCMALGEIWPWPTSQRTSRNVTWVPKTRKLYPIGSATHLNRNPAVMATNVDPMEAGVPFKKNNAENRTMYPGSRVSNPAWRGVRRSTTLGRRQTLRTQAPAIPTAMMQRTTIVCRVTGVSIRGEDDALVGDRVVPSWPGENV